MDPLYSRARARPVARSDQRPGGYAGQRICA